jgi:chromosome segregation ATPase
MPVLEKLGQTMRENDDLKGQLKTKEKEMRDKDAALNEARKGLLDSVWKDFSAIHDSTAKLKEKDQEMLRKLQEKDREISKQMTKHQSEFTAQKKHLEEEGKRQIARLTKEKEEAAKDLEESRSLISRMRTELQDTTMLMNAAKLEERAMKRQLATMQEEMGLKEVVEDELSVIYPTIYLGPSH